MFRMQFLIVGGLLLLAFLVLATPQPALAQSCDDCAHIECETHWGKVLVSTFVETVTCGAAGAAAGLGGVIVCAIAWEIFYEEIDEEFEDCSEQDECYDECEDYCGEGGSGFC